ncbi:hypothetical protein [Clostridium brassicae]|uniref:STAS/SEC14 domain-containing protein n=1 Tax=Clostridium brassicae TaxID=2999072 RepID=A0ABT4D7P1_9CLOT|nr:hypothetical protein [Clostridium brassicae]MCY6958280.1 hypothetical protein [Clostridium brassicae]
MGTNRKEKTPKQKLYDITGNMDKAVFIIWYCTPEDERPNFDDWKGNIHNKTKETIENWLLEEKVQEGIQYYLSLIKKKNLLKIYQKQVDLALNGDTKSASWVADFSESTFFDNTDNEAKEWLDTIRKKKQLQKK